MELKDKMATSDPEHPACSKNLLPRKQEDPVQVHHQCLIDATLPLSHTADNLLCQHFYNFSEVIKELQEDSNHLWLIRTFNFI